MSTRGTRLPNITAEGFAGPTIINTVITVGIIAGALYLCNLSTKKEHYVSKRGKIANNIGQTQLNEQIGKKNKDANRMKKLIAGGKFDYSKNSYRDNKSILYRR